MNSTETCEKNPVNSKASSLKSPGLIAHDLQSPISALNFVLSLNPQLPAASQNILKMTIERLKSLAADLNSY